MGAGWAPVGRRLGAGRAPVEANGVNPVGCRSGAGRVPVVRMAMIKVIASCNNLNNHASSDCFSYLHPAITFSRLVLLIYPIKI